LNPGKKGAPMNNFNFISLNVKCPDCGKSLMDHEHKVDNEPSIKLLIKTANNSGTINLSSIYGSYNFICDLPLNDGDIAEFFCPLCKTDITSEELCSTCQAPMSTVILDIGGKISFCSRKGCKNHNIGFEDLSNALTKLYQEFGHRGAQTSEEAVHLKETKKVKTQEEENKEILETGTYLQSYCPHCKKSLIEGDMLKFKIVKKEGDSGFIMLSPYLNVFSSKSTIFLPEEQSVGDIRCPHCDISLMVSDGKCEKCGTQIAKILVGARTKMIEFFICAKKGCTWHGLNKKDLDDIRLEDSLEW
jgi:Zn finger protein HypA/HybF involved in hydrogenase expression